MSTMAAHRARLQDFQDLLNEEVINADKLRKFCFTGVPESHGLRSQCWKILLNYLPPQRNQWNEVLNRKRAQYCHFVEEMVVESSRLSQNGASAILADHPLNTDADSHWGSFFRDNIVLTQIDKDVRRLCPDIMFFQMATDHPCGIVVDNPDVERLHRRVTYSTLASETVTRKGLGITKMEVSTRRSQAGEDYKPLPLGSEAHWEVLERILFVYAKLNPGQSYVQGMNEIIGPIYYTFATDSNLETRENAEADCFFCFISLMGEIRDFFIRTLDESGSGIGAMMNRLMLNLKRHDHQLWHRLQLQELRPQYFSFRWLTLLLSQEFALPDVIRIWDSLFSDPQRFTVLIQVCTAMLVLQRNALLESDFATNVKLLQNYPPVDIQIIVTRAVELVEEDLSTMAMSSLES